MMGIATPTICNLDNASKVRNKRDKFKTFFRKNQGTLPYRKKLLPGSI